jgi:hypothetical protein
MGFCCVSMRLEEIWYLMHARNSVESMLTGHYYSRALPAHFNTQAALAVNILQNYIHLDQQERSATEALVERFGQNSDMLEVIQISAELKSICTKFVEFLETIGSVSRTAKLWAQYFHQVQLIRNYIRVERSGNWQLHLQCVKEMLPYFHAAGHLHYAKSVHLYLQQMTNLQNLMSQHELELFTSHGYFTIR